MNRRELVTAFLILAATRPKSAEAQQSSGKVWRIGYLYPGDLDNPSDHAALDFFRAELGRLGFPEGRAILDAKGAKGKPDELLALAKEIVDARPDVVVAIATPAIAAVQKTTSTIPIVMMPATDPIGSGFIQSLAHPGGNITGMANMYGDSIGKSIELLHGLLPNAKRVAVLMSANPTHPQQLEIARAATSALGLTVMPVVAVSQSDLQQAFAKMREDNCDALFVLADPVRPPVVSLAAQSKILAVYQYAGYVDMGGLASYGAEFSSILRKGAEYVVRIIKGAKPTETPVEQPVKFEFVLNLNTAKQLGVSVPEAALNRADRIIE